jgi:hypothetical protein
MEEDIYEMHLVDFGVNSGSQAAWMRQYMWANLVSGSHPTFGGAA